MTIDDVGSETVEASEPPKKRRRILRWLLWILGSSIALPVLAGLAVLWRVNRGPVSLALIESRVERAINSIIAPLVIDLDRPTLLWQGRERPLVIRAATVRLHTTAGELLELSDSGIGIAVSPLLDGILAPVWVEIDTVQLALVRGSDGRFELGLRQPGTGDAAEDSTELTAVLQRWIDGSDPTAPIGSLSTIRLRNVSWAIDDRRMGHSWGGHDGKIDLHREPGSIRVELDTSLNLGDHSIPLSLSLTTREAGSFEGQVTFRALEPAWLSDLDPALSALEPLELSLSGRVEFELHEWVELRSVDFELETDVASLGGTLHGGVRELRANLSIRNGKPWLAATIYPGLEWLKGIRLPLEGTMKLLLRDGDLESIQAELSAGKGSLSIDGVYDDPLEVDRIDLRGSIRPAQGTVRLDRVKVGLGDTEITATLDAERQQGQFSGRLDVGMNQLEVDRVGIYWPPMAATEARHWVLTHLGRGLLHTAQVTLVGTADSEVGALEVDRVSAGLQFQGMSLDVLPPKPAILGLSGSATFADGRLDVEVERGRMAGISIDRGQASIRGLDAEQTTLELTVVTRGPVRSAMALLQGEPLDVIDDADLAPDKLSGEHRTELSLRLPLSGDGEGQPDALTVRSNLQNAGWSAAPLGLRVAGIAGRLLLEGEELSIQGRATANGLPATVNFVQQLGDGDPIRTLAVQATPDVKFLAALGVETRPYLTGKLDVDVTYETHRSGLTEIRASIDVAQAEMTVPLIGWSKESGRPGVVEVTATSPDGARWTLTPVDLSLDDLEAHGELVVGFEPLALERLQLNELAYPGNRLGGSFVHDAENGYRVEVDGERVDLGPLVRYLKARGREAAAEQPAPASPDATTPPDENREPITFRIALDQLVADSGVRLDAVTAEGSFDGAVWQTVKAAGRVPPDGSLAVNLGSEGGERTLSFKMIDVGAVIRELGFSGELTGGTLVISATPSPDGQALVGTFELTDIGVKDQPALATILRLSSLNGLLGSLNGDGILIERAAAPFAYGDGRLEFSDLKIFAQGLGINAHGAIDFRGGSNDVRGTLVPASTLQKVLGKIPLLGRVLTGVDREGVVATRFTITGPLGDPKVSVDGLSTLTVGITRDIVRLFSHEDPDKPDEQTGAEPD